MLVSGCKIEVIEPVSRSILRRISRLYLERMVDDDMEDLDEVLDVGVTPNVVPLAYVFCSPLFEEDSEREN